MTINGERVTKTYRVQNGFARLHVTTSGKIYWGTPDAGRCSHVANVGDRGSEGRTKDAVCQAANCW